MPFYHDKRELENRDIEAILTAWPTTDQAGTTPATHAELKASLDFDSAKDEVEAALTVDLVNAGVVVEADAVAPSWVVVTLPADVQTNGEWETFWHDLAKNITEAHTAKMVAQVSGTLALSEDGITPSLPITVVAQEGVWKIRDRKDRWLGATGYISQIITALGAK